MCVWMSVPGMLGSQGQKTLVRGAADRKQLWRILAPSLRGCRQERLPILPNAWLGLYELGGGESYRGEVLNIFGRKYLKFLIFSSWEERHEKEISGWLCVPPEQPTEPPRQVSACQTHNTTHVGHRAPPWMNMSTWRQGHPVHVPPSACKWGQTHTYPDVPQLSSEQWLKQGRRVKGEFK